MGKQEGVGWASILRKIEGAGEGGLDWRAFSRNRAGAGDSGRWGVLRPAFWIRAGAVSRPASEGDRRHFGSLLLGSSAFQLYLVLGREES